MRLHGQTDMQYRSGKVLGGGGVGVGFRSTKAAQGYDVTNSSAMKGLVVTAGVLRKHSDYACSVH